MPRILMKIAVAAALLVSASGSEASAAEKGLMTDMTWGVSDEVKERTGAMLRDSGSRWIRLHFDWYSMDADPTWLAEYDRAVEVAQAAGQKILVVLCQAPPWASGSTNPNAPPRDPEDFADWVRPLVARYKGRVQAWEIWNEPDTALFWPTAPDAGAYARLLQASHRAIKAADSAAQVVLGGLVANNVGYLEQLYAAEPQIGRSFDVMATHPYILAGGSPEDVALDADGHVNRYSFTGYRELRRVLLEHQDPKPIWITEFGWATTTQSTMWGGVDEATQAERLRQAYELLEQDPYVEVAFWYNLRNNFWAPDADTFEDQMGLLRADWSPKPSYAAFKAYAPPAAPNRAIEAPLPTAAEAPAAPPASGPGPAIAAFPATARTTVSVAVGHRRSRLRAIHIRGRASSVTARRVHLRIRGSFRGASGRSRRQVRTLFATVNDGRYSTRLRLRRSGSWRIEVTDAGTDVQSRRFKT